MTNIENELKNKDIEYVLHASDSYELPQLPNTRNMRIDTIWDAIRTIEDLEDVYKTFIADIEKGDFFVHRDYVPDKIAIGVLRYLGKEYINSALKNFFVVSRDLDFERYMDKFEQPLIRRLSRYIGSSKEEVKDDCGGLNDIAHLALSTVVKLTRNFSPDYWASWGGDLATGMGDIHYYCNEYPRLSTQKIADIIIGGHPTTLSRYAVDNNIKITRMKCNFTDLCDDADAIALSEGIRKDKNSDTILSKTMKKYYGRVYMQLRFRQYSKEGFNIESIRDMIYMLIDKVGNDKFDADTFDRLKENATEYEKRCACDSLAHFIYFMAR